CRHRLFHLLVQSRLGWFRFALGIICGGVELALLLAFFQASGLWCLRFVMALRRKLPEGQAFERRAAVR
ncbi:MAG: hypothetical protein K8F91_06275, partial [Candidatus Obscuribacterales bacterium]|nr:hypothetical protein [Candidatus Obscuribacterales bacterium]